MMKGQASAQIFFLEPPLPLIDWLKCWMQKKWQRNNFVKFYAVCKLSSLIETAQNGYMYVAYVYSFKNRVK